MHKFLLYFTFVTLVASVGCSPGPPPSPGSSGEGAQAVEYFEIQQLQPLFDIGDIESYTHFWVELSEESESPTIENVEVFSKKEELTKAILNISKPYPKELWLRLNTKLLKTFAGYAVAMRVRLFLDGKEIEAFDFIYENLMDRIPRTRRVEVMSNFGSIPETALVHAEATIIMFAEEEFNEDELDSVQLTPKNSVTILSNPLRINFRS